MTEFKRILVLSLKEAVNRLENKSLAPILKGLSDEDLLGHEVALGHIAFQIVYLAKQQDIELSNKATTDIAVALCSANDPDGMSALTDGIRNAIERSEAPPASYGPGERAMRNASLDQMWHIPDDAEIS